MDTSPATIDPPPIEPAPSPLHSRRASVVLWSVIFVMAAGLLVYSQTMSFVWDEGFHILAAQLIDNGKTPYLDFCFPQTPLNVYWNALWMHVFGQDWHVTHVFAALLVAAGVVLMSQFVFSRFPIRRWQLGCALVVAFFIGLNTTVVQFGTVAQAYGMGLFLGVAAFRVTVASVNRKRPLLAFAAGLLAGAAAGSTLLTAPVPPVLLIWLLVYNLDGKRSSKLIAFLIGALIPFAPVFWLFAKAPRVVFFNIIQYQAMYRRVNWNGATPHDVDVLSAWLNDSQSLFLGLLAIAGVWFLVRKSNWYQALRAEFLLCAWLSLALVLYISTAHPTFTRYFIFATPFAAALGALGFYAVATRLASSQKPLVPTVLLSGLLTLSLARALFDDRDSTTWHDYEEIALKVEQVTPANGRLYADELVYFLLRRTPPSGMEFSYAHKIELPKAEEALYHIVSQRELTAQVKAGKFDTVQTCNDDLTDEMNLPNIFPHHADVGDCTVYWGKVKSAGAHSTPAAH